MTPMLKPVEEQVVVLVGASSGIGRATARAFARRGARVVLAARSEPDLQRVAREVERISAKAAAKAVAKAVARGERGGTRASRHVPEAPLVVPLDVRRFDEVEALARRTVERFGRIDTWVHLASVTLYATFEETTPDEFRTILETDLLGQAHGAWAALPWLRQEGRGALIHVSSIEAKRALPYQAAYAAAKHGISAFTEALRSELEAEGVPIAVTNVMPASIDTPAFEKARTKLGVRPAPVPPVYDPEEVAAAIVRAAEEPQRDVMVGASAKLLALGQALAPRLVDRILGPLAMRAQRTLEPKGVSAPDDLEAPLVGVAGVRGSKPERGVRGALRSVAGTLAAGAALGAILGLRRRSRRGRAARR
jgi:NAD(P)-dependent dehydrogenase (short-subunit alcohol dehydrogenase family)